MIGKRDMLILSKSWGRYTITPQDQAWHIHGWRLGWDFVVVGGRYSSAGVGVDCPCSITRGASIVH